MFNVFWKRTKKWTLKIVDTVAEDNSEADEKYIKKLQQCDQLKTGKNNNNNNKKQ